MIFFDPEISLLGIYPKEMIRNVDKNFWTNMS